MSGIETVIEQIRNSPLVLANFARGLLLKGDGASRADVSNSSGFRYASGEPSEAVKGEAFTMSVWHDHADLRTWPERG